MLEKDIYNAQIMTLNDVEDLWSSLRRNLVVQFDILSLDSQNVDVWTPKPVQTENTT